MLRLSAATCVFASGVYHGLLVSTWKDVDTTIHVHVFFLLFFADPGVFSLYRVLFNGAFDIRLYKQSGPACGSPGASSRPTGRGRGMYVLPLSHRLCRHGCADLILGRFIAFFGDF